MTRSQLQKAYDDLLEEHEQLKQDYNEVRTSVLATYELLSDEELETASDDSDDEGDEE